MTTTEGKFNWADELETPTEEKKNEITDGQGNADQNKKESSDLDKAQADGSTTWLNGSGGLEEPDEFNVNVKLADLQADPNNPLYSVKNFSDLKIPEEIMRGMAVMGFHKPSKIQERALPLLMHNPAKNLIGQSQSGTGKTAAFTLNMLTRIDLASQAPQCLVLAPTRELAKQIAGVAKMMGAFLADKGLVVAEAVPDQNNRNKQVTGQIVVGTPGTTGDMIKRRLLDPRAIKVLTLDEADNMLEMGSLGDQCKRVKQTLPRNIQVVLFSATFPPKVLEFAGQFAPSANMITLEAQQLTVKGIKQMYLDCSSDEEKYEALVKFYGLMTIASSIIFVKRRDTAAEIERRMTSEGHKVASLTGALDGDQRDEVFTRFRTGDAKVLITTNVLARGIDVQSVTMVVNYDIPETVDKKPDFETYLHRIGRTGRFGRTGAALSFVSDRQSWEMLMSICNHFGVEPTKLDTEDWDHVEKMLKNIMRNARNVVVPEDEPTAG